MLEADQTKARHRFIDARRAVLDAAEHVADGRARGTLSAAAIDRLVVEVEAFQTARRHFLLLIPET